MPFRCSRTLGLSAAVTMPGVPVATVPRACWGRMAERSPGKDSVTGHWELMGVVLDRAVSDVSRTRFRRR